MKMYPIIEQTKDYEEGKTDERKRILDIIKELQETGCNGITKMHYIDSDKLKSKILGEKEQ